MSTIVLIHGAFANHHVWRHVAPQLEKQGFNVLAVDLPGHGSDQTPHSEVTLQTYIDHVSNIVSSLPGQAILVGHSEAGMTISGVAEKVPERLSKIVYLAAAIPKNGQSFLDIMKRDPNSLMGKYLEPGDQSSGAKLDKNAFFDALGKGHITDLPGLLLQIEKAEPSRALTDKIQLSDERFGKVRKVYIGTTRDHTISTEYQKQMIAENGQIEKVYTMGTGHLRFLAFPDELVKILAEIARE